MMPHLQYLKLQLQFKSKITEHLYTKRELVGAVLLLSVVSADGSCRIDGILALLNDRKTLCKHVSAFGHLTVKFKSEPTFYVTSPGKDATDRLGVPLLQQHHTFESLFSEGSATCVPAGLNMLCCCINIACTRGQNSIISGVIGTDLVVAASGLSRSARPGT
jgi:hypothetical protein